MHSCAVDASGHRGGRSGHRQKTLEMKKAMLVAPRNCLVPQRALNHVWRRSGRS
ncbi:hypothetical protein RSPO_c00590 [Ralstonia solanacearum Po82]|uniref:Uncharacterized protein n=1 Tax=Ralstonia solanacearum (strain Po82) TaxID=1031711 RepID=F6FY87_RALS8|nr:hypothetical protein RSPO_c00590 [Ralstonia solanacearum Po82]